MKLVLGLVSNIGVRIATRRAWVTLFVLLLPIWHAFSQVTETENAPPLVISSVEDAISLGGRPVLRIHGNFFLGAVSDPAFPNETDSPVRVWIADGTGRVTELLVAVYDSSADPPAEILPGDYSPPNLIRGISLPTTDTIVEAYLPPFWNSCSASKGPP
ncbi:MAG TPA: hypothetical protein VLK65_00735, partial [Vicinamibacteria bacterium]|nr:hypothetical protein [Vicinamibacteria bacterium]